MVEWYLRTYFGTPDDPGTLAMFADAGSFKVSADEVRRSDSDALFRLLLACALFQRQRDFIVLRLLRSVPPAEVAELQNAKGLLEQARHCGCPHLQMRATLNTDCDLHWDAVTGDATCTRLPETLCPPKRHAVSLKRYADFGLTPTSLALVLHEAHVADLAGLYERVCTDVVDPLERAIRLEQEITKVRRVGVKIASMYLSLLSNPDLTPEAPWSEGLDWTHYVVIDSNVSLFLASIGYTGPESYEARRTFVQDLAKRIDLKALDSSLHSFNPRLVQQAMYLFMSADNRRQATRDCSKSGPNTCSRCPNDLRSRCVLQQN